MLDQMLFLCVVYYNMLNHKKLFFLLHLGIGSNKLKPEEKKRVEEFFESFVSIDYYKNWFSQFELPENSNFPQHSDA